MHSQARHGVKLNSIAIRCLVMAPNVALAQSDRPTPSAECRMITAADLGDSKAPAFTDHPANTEVPESSAKLDLARSPIARTYRTVLRLEVAKGPNYAGHYRMASWGWGASCAMFAVIDLMDGIVIAPTEFTTVLGVHLAADDFLPGTQSDSWDFGPRTIVLCS